MAYISSDLEAARQHALLSHASLWVRYVGLGGTLGLPEVTAYLGGDGAACTRVEHDTLVHALNEAFCDLGMNHPVPYTEDG